MSVLLLVFHTETVIGKDICRVLLGKLARISRGSSTRYMSRRRWRN
ncbi:MAG: hypothetical protein QXS51_06505 [Thermoproteota archaeon]